MDEQTWRGHVGREVKLNLRLQLKTGLPYRLDGNPGGLAGVWAVENSREAIFDALKSREAFGTSGPRIRPRFFAGWTYPANLCSDSDFLSAAYANGVPMGGELPPARAATARPRFLLAASRDPEGAKLERLQLIKGWIDADGRAHIDVIDAVGSADTGADGGRGQLCALYVDETFRPDQPAYYYLRVLEVPTERWSWPSVARCQSRNVQTSAAMRRRKPSGNAPGHRRSGTSRNPADSRAPWERRWPRLSSASRLWMRPGTFYRYRRDGAGITPSCGPTMARA